LKACKRKRSWPNLKHYRYFIGNTEYDHKNLVDMPEFKSFATQRAVRSANVQQSIPISIIHKQLFSALLLHAALLLHGSVTKAKLLCPTSCEMQNADPLLPWTSCETLRNTNK
jgi:hypothetical protein